MHRYRSKISGPLLDRIDMHLEVPAQRPDLLASAHGGQTTAEARVAVVSARERMLARQGCANAQLEGKAMRKHLQAADDGLTLLHQAVDSLGLSARAYDRILRVARTIADLDARERVALDDISEAIGYRVLDRPAG